MNQEEWLEYRRSLGLPADPEKDFPPGYRSEPTISPGPDVVRNTGMSPRQRRRAEASQDSARRASRDARTPGPTPNAQQSSQAQRAMADALRTFQQQSGLGGSGPQAGPAYGRGPTSAPSGAPPAPGTPGRPGPQGTAKPKKGNAIGCLVVFLVIVAIIVFNGVLPLIPKVVDLFKSGSGGSSSPGTTTTGGDVLTERRKQEQVDRTNVLKESDRVMDLFGRGDPSIASAIRTANTSYDARLLTPAQAKATMGADPRWERTGDDVSGYVATVKGTLTTTAGTIPVELRFVKSGDTWEHSALRVPVLRTTGGDLPTGTTVNGTKVTLKPSTGSSGLLVWPGRTTVKLPADKFTTYTEPTQTLTAVGMLGTAGSQDSFTVTVDPKRTAEFTRQAKAAAAANLKSCLSATTLAPKNCPFGGSVSNSVSKVSGVKFTQTVPVKKWEVSGGYGSETIWGTGGEVSVSATGWKTTGNGRGYTTGIRGTWETFVGDVAVKNGKVVFTAH
jgi:hypothetical protein